MHTFKCCLCFKPGNQVPPYFKTVLTDFIQSFNKFQSHRFNRLQPENLTLCKSCWIYFMRIHQLDYELRLKKETCDAQKAFLSSKFRQAQRSISKNGNNVPIPDAFAVQSSAAKGNDDYGSNVSGQTLEGDFPEAISCSLTNTDESDNESLVSCGTVKVTATDDDPVSASSQEKEPTQVTSVHMTDIEPEPKTSKPIRSVSTSAISLEEIATEVTSDDRSDSDCDLESPKPVNNVPISPSKQQHIPTEPLKTSTSDDTSDSGSESESIQAASVDTSDSSSKSELAETDDLTFAYENKWAPKHLSIPNSSPVIKRLSEIDFNYKNEYPFQATDGGFQCGLCTVMCPFPKIGVIWQKMYLHLKRKHEDVHKEQGKKRYQRFVEVAPNHFQYGKYTAEWIDGNYRCGECGVFKVPKPGCKNANIITHIINHHEKPSRTYVCEYCGKVYHGPNGLRVHKISKHETSDRQFPCDDCGKVFVCRIKAYYHQRKAHGIKKKFICEICGKEFKENQILRTHVDTVHNVQQIKCKDCDKTFGSRMALTVHRYGHTGKKFTCDICGMEFTQSYSVTRHKKTAHNK